MLTTLNLIQKGTCLTLLIEKDAAPEYITPKAYFPCILKLEAQIFIGKLL